MILAADVGASRTRLGLFTRTGGVLRAAREAEEAAEGTSFDANLAAFLVEGRPRVHRCGISVAAGHDGVDPRRLARRLSLSRIVLLDAVTATAHGVAQLTRRQLVSLNPGARGRRGNAALLLLDRKPSLGLLLPGGDGPLPGPVLGLGRGFAPADDLQVALLRFLRRRGERIVLSSLLSEAVLSEIYAFFRDNGWGESSSALRSRLRRGEPPHGAILASGLKQADDLAVRVVRFYVALLGAVVYDLAAACDTKAGVYLGGEFARQLRPALRQGDFAAALQGVPVRLIADPRAALLGAAACASEGPSAARPKMKKKTTKKKR